MRRRPQGSWQQVQLPGDLVQPIAGPTRGTGRCRPPLPAVQREREAVLGAVITAVSGGKAAGQPRQARNACAARRSRARRPGPGQVSATPTPPGSSLAAPTSRSSSNASATAASAPQRSTSTHLRPGRLPVGPAARCHHRRPARRHPAGGPVRPGALDWLKTNFYKTELELGHCLRFPQEGPCECDLSLACAKFVTTPQYAPRLRDRLCLERQLADDAQARGWDREAR
jgi:hypothetical protein